MAVKKETKTKKKKILVSNGEGQVHIFANANNTLVTLTDSQGNALAQCSAGALGNRGAKKTTPFAAQEAVAKCLENATAESMNLLIISSSSNSIVPLKVRSSGETGTPKRNPHNHQCLVSSLSIKSSSL